MTMKWDDAKTKYLLEQISSCYGNGTLKGMTAVPRADDIDRVVNQFNIKFHDKEKLNQQRIRNRMLVLTNKFKNFQKIEDFYLKGIDIRKDEFQWNELIKKYPGCQEFEKEDFIWFYPMKLMYQGRYHSNKFKINQRSFSDDEEHRPESSKTLPDDFHSSRPYHKLPPINYSDFSSMVSKDHPPFPISTFPTSPHLINSDPMERQYQHKLEYISHQETDRTPVVAQAMQVLEQMSLTSTQFAKAVKLLSDPQLATAFLYLSDEYKIVYLRGSGIFD